jgi:hypothetical protein
MYRIEYEHAYETHIYSISNVLLSPVYGGFFFLIFLNLFDMQEPVLHIVSLKSSQATVKCYDLLWS